jgi:drug/metabolite transporter (DMT)-like permease
MLSATIPLVEITWLRWIGLVVAVLPALVASGGTVLRSAAPRLQVFRSLGLVGSSFFFICGVSQLSLPSAISISFVSPLFVTALSIPLLGEEVGIRRWAALVVGLAGVLVVIRPGSGTFEPAALFPLVSSSCWAAAVVTTRKLGTADPPMTVLTYTALVGFALLSLFVPADFVMPAGWELWVAGALAIFSLGGQFLTLLAYRYAPASLLVPFSYMQLIWSTTFGYLIFGNLPDFWTWLGAGIVIASGIYTAHRERVRHKEAFVRDHLIRPFKG